MTEPLPCLTVGLVHFGSNSSRGVSQTITLPSEPKRLSFHLSNQTIFFQKSHLLHNPSSNINEPRLNEITSNIKEKRRIHVSLVKKPKIKFI